MEVELVGTFVAGLLTFVTPCVLPMIPIYLTLLASGVTRPGNLGRGQHFFSALLFSLGLILVFVAMGMTATAFGAFLLAHRGTLTILGGLLIFLFGLKFLGYLQVPFLDREFRLKDKGPGPQSHHLNAFIMGLVFGFGWTPCVGPILGAVLTYTASKTADPLRGATLLALYGLGFVTPLLILSLTIDGARRLAGRMNRHLPRVQWASGALMAGVGLWLIFTADLPPRASSTAPVVSAKGVIIDPPLGKPSVRPRMVQFTSSSCSICRQMIPTVAVIERDCDGRKVDVIKVDLTNEANRRLAQDYGVRGVPTFVFLDEKGREAARMVGYQTIAALRQSLAAMVGENCDGVGVFPDFGGSPKSGSQCGGNSQAVCGDLPAQGTRKGQRLPGG